MKICDVTQFYSPVSGGVKRYIHEKIRYLHEHTASDEHVLIIPGERDETIAGGRAKTCTIKSPLISRTSRYRVLLRLGVLAEILEREKPDVIECGDPYQVAWKTLSAAASQRVPVVAFYHSHFAAAYLPRWLHGTARIYTRSLYNRVARTFVPSPALAMLLRDWGVANTEPIDLGVNTAIFKPETGEPDEKTIVRAKLGVPDGRTLLLYVGRLAPEKNTRVLFEAFEILHREQPARFHLLAVGDGQQRALLQGLENRTGAVTWLPYCGEPERLARLYRAADLFVHPGVQETFGIVALESQACGTPVVGVRGSYMDRIIHCDQTLWANENSPAALARAIAGFGAQDLTCIGAAASEAVAQRYSWTRVFERLFAIYRSVITG